MDDWSSFRTTTSEQQRLRAALSGFCESQDLPEEQRAAYTAYLRKRIRSAVETLIREDNFSRLETLLQTGWLSDADRKRFLNLAADQQKWQAFRILLNRNSQDPMQENTESRKTEAVVQKEKPTKEKEALALRLFEEARTESDFLTVVDEWNKLDINRERRERDHENLRGDVPLEFQAVPEPRIVPL